MTVLLSEPSLQQVFKDLEHAQLSIQSRTQQAKDKFEGKRLYPELGIIHDAMLDSYYILKYRDRVWAAFNGAGSVRDSSTLGRLYKSLDLELITTSKQLETLFEFTRWLFMHYKEVYEVGSPLAGRVVENMRTDFRGKFINTRRGVLYLRYCGQDGRNKAQMYSYATYVEQKETTRCMLTLVPDVTLRPADSETVFTRDDLFICNASSFITVVCDVSASLEETVLPILRSSLLTWFVELSGATVSKVSIR